MRARRIVQVLVMCYPGENTKIFEPHIARVFAPCVPQLLLGANAKEQGRAHSAACMLWWRGRRSDACCLPACLSGARLEDLLGQRILGVIRSTPAAMAARCPDATKRPPCSRAEKRGVPQAFLRRSIEQSARRMLAFRT